MGSGRCGTTMVAALLDGWTDIAVSPETHFLARCLRRHEREGTLSRRRLHAIARQLGRHRRYQLLGLPVTPGELARAASPPTVAGLCHTVYRSYADQRGKPRWGDQTPFYGKNLALLARAFPDAQFVHLIRDGRDCARSVLRCQWGPRNFHRAGQWWVRSVSRTREQGRTLEPGRYLEVFYERLMAEPEGQVQRLCDFLGEPMTPVLRAIARCEPGAPYQLRQDNCDKWRTLPRSGVRRFEAVAGPLLSELGYERAFPDVGPSSRFHRLCFWLDHHGRSLPLMLRDADQSLRHLFTRNGRPTC